MALDIVPNTEVTFAVWINSADLANCSAMDCRIAAKATGTASADHYIMVSTIKDGSTTKLRFRLKAGGTTQTLIASSGNLVNDQWYHVAATYDGANMRLFLGGAPVGSIAKTGLIDANAAVPFWLGGSPDAPTSKPWDGLIDDARLYTRALSQVEIEQLAQVAP